MPIRSLRWSVGYVLVAATVLAVTNRQAQGQSIQVQALLDQGDRAFARADYESAGKLYDRAIVAEPLTIDAAYYAKRADIFVFSKQYAQGLRWIATTAEAHKPGDPLILAKKALLLESTGQHAQAIALAEEVVERAPRDYALQLLVGDHHFARRAEGADRAVAAYTAFLANRPAQLEKADAGIRLRLGYASLYKGDFAQARTQLDTVLQLTSVKDANRSEARLARAGLCAALTGMELWTQAVTSCRQAIAQSQPGKGDPALQYNLAKANLGLGQMAAALAVVNAYLQLRPKALDGHLLRGDIYAGRGDWDRAEGEYREAARLDPKSPDPVLRLGRLHLRERRPHPDLALAELKTAYQAYPDALDIVADLAAAHLANRQYTEARTLALMSLEKTQGTGRAPLLTIIGDSYYMEGKVLDRAAAAYASALSADPDHAAARTGLVNSLNLVGRSRLTENNFDAAQAALERAITVDPKSAMSQFNLGLVLVERGKHRAAVKPLSLAHEYAPLEARVEHLLARALAKSGDVAQAMDHLRSARATALRAGDNALAAESSTDLGPLLIDAGRVDEAVDVLEQAVSLGGGAAGEEARANLQLAYLRRGVARLRANDDDGALADLTRATQRLPALSSTESAVARFALALAQLRTGRSGRAADVLAAVEREAGRDPITWLAPPFDRDGLHLFVAYAAYAEGTLDSLDRAITNFERLSTRVPRGLAPRVRELLRSAYERLAWQAYGRGRRRLAIKSLDKARNAGTVTNGPVMVHNLAVLRGGDEARRTFERLGSRPPEALINLGILEEAAGDPRRAYDLWKAARAAGVRFSQLDTWLARKRTYFGYQ